MCSDIWDYLTNVQCVFIDEFITKHAFTFVGNRKLFRWTFIIALSMHNRSAMTQYIGKRARIPSLYVYATNDAIALKTTLIIATPMIRWTDKTKLPGIANSPTANDIQYSS